MFIPKYWARVTDPSRTCVGWSDVSALEAEQMARARLARIQALGDEPTPSDWDYYPSSPVREEILETPVIPGVATVITRNRSGAKVLNVDRVVFVDIDMHTRAAPLFASIGALFRKKKPAANSEEDDALEGVRAWTERSTARLRAYRTAGGLRLILMDRLLDPAGEECANMFRDLAADPYYGRLCRVQKSFRARLTPKPRRVDCAAAPCSHPRTEAQSRRDFQVWLESYERAGAGLAVCELIAEYGSAGPVAAAQSVAALHDRYTLLAGGTLA